MSAESRPSARHGAHCTNRANSPRRKLFRCVVPVAVSAAHSPRRWGTLSTHTGVPVAVGGVHVRAAGVL